MKRKAKDKYNLKGIKFDRLLVVKRSHNHRNKEGKPMWKCLCDCQLSKSEEEREYKYVVTAHLISGSVRSGGCLADDTRPKADNLTGMVFGMLLALERSDDYINDKGEKTVMWKCECQCEEKNIRYVSARNLKSGNTKSCGCLQKEQMIKFNKETKHMQNRFKFHDNVVECFIDRDDNPVLLDLDDFEKVKNYYWNIKKGSNGKYVKIYTTSNDLQKETSMAQIITKVNGVDHWNRNTYDNRKVNLRPATQKENSYNRSKFYDGTSKIMGVSLEKSKGRWKSAFGKHWIGSYELEEEAIKARLQFEHDFCKEFSPQWMLFPQYGIDDSDLDYWGVTFANPETQKKYGYKPSPLPTEEEIKKYQKQPN